LGLVFVFGSSSPALPSWARRKKGAGGENTVGYKSAESAAVDWPTSSPESSSLSSSWAAARLTVSVFFLGAATGALAAAAGYMEAVRGARGHVL
jgi:hypothetical protein